MPASSTSRRRRSLALSRERCFTGCKGLALDLELGPKVCIHCWQRPGGSREVDGILFGGR